MSRPKGLSTTSLSGINNGQWFSGTNMDYTDWCSAGEVTSGSVVLDPTNNYCWKEATVEEAGVICQRRSGTYCVSQNESFFLLTLRLY